MLESSVARCGGCSLHRCVTTGRRAANMSSQHRCHGSHDLGRRVVAAAFARGANVHTQSGCNTGIRRNCVTLGWRARGRDIWRMAVWKRKTPVKTASRNSGTSKGNAGLRVNFLKNTRKPVAVKMVSRRAMPTRQMSVPGRKVSKCHT